MLIGIDDTDSPEGMCTTYLGAVLVQRLTRAKMGVREARLVRLNPNVPYKTRGNAAICLDVTGRPGEGFLIACQLVEELACMDAEQTHPGVVVTERPLPPDFYWRAVRDFCTLDEALCLLNDSGALFRGYKARRGLIGATAAVSCELPDHTYELLAYRKTGVWGSPRFVDPSSIFLAESHTYPHTWDSVDRKNNVVVCVPHTPDPVLFGIRGERPGWVQYAREWIVAEKPGIEQVFITNQGTDAHLQHGVIGHLKEGCSYLIPGNVSTRPVTGKGGHVSFEIGSEGRSVRCMAYEPTKGFRDIIRDLRPGDEVLAAGSYKQGSINLEKIGIRSLSSAVLVKPPVCERCGRRMTSAGTQKGYKCRHCGGRAKEAEVTEIPRSLSEGWYEVPPSARRHLAKPLCRGEPPLH